MYDESSGHYTADDGIFTSPLDGVYQFELNLVSLSEIYTIEIYLNDAIGLCLQFLIMCVTWSLKHFVSIIKALCSILNFISVLNIPKCIKYMAMDNFLVQTHNDQPVIYSSLKWTVWIRCNSNLLVSRMIQHLASRTKWPVRVSAVNYERVFNILILYKMFVNPNLWFCRYVDEIVCNQISVKLIRLYCLNAIIPISSCLRFMEHLSIVMLLMCSIWYEYI